MVVQNLDQLTQQIEEQYAGLCSFVVRTDQISLTKAGLLSTGKNEFPLTVEGDEQFARKAKIPVELYRKLPSELQAMLFNHLFQAEVAAGSIAREIRINLNKEERVIGFDDPKLLKVNPMDVIDAVHKSLPEGLSAEHIEVSRVHLTHAILSFSCFSADKATEPRVGDIVNGGIDLHHSIAGEFGTQVCCYLRRQICANGACIHVCEDERSIRARRLPNGLFDAKDMLDQVCRVLTQAWSQINTKLEAIKGLVDKPWVSIDFLSNLRTRFSLSNNVLDSIEAALNQDEIGRTRTAYDLFNAISRVATHDDSLSLRQQRRLMSLAGEFSQQTVSRCPQCKNWFIETS